MSQSLQPINYEARLVALEQWLIAQTGESAIVLEPVSGDASFRRYFRFYHRGHSQIAMDAPPSHEDSQPFVALARAYAEMGVPVPAIKAQDLSQGFLWLSDLGDTLLLGRLTDDSATGFYQTALTQLLPIQQVLHTELGPLPLFDSAMLQREMALFSDWLVARYLGLELDGSTQAMFTELFAALEHNALAQPQVGVHRDYHSRNLMVQADGVLGVIDFQDAVQGPLTYDAVSLLRDCYIRWPDAEVAQWREYFRQALQQEHGVEYPAATFARWFDLMGMQRHLKAAGIFARLWLRDGKSGYLNDIPQTVGYLIEYSGRYPEFASFQRWLTEVFMPAWQAKQH